MPDVVTAALIGEWFDRYAAGLSWYAAQWTTEPDDCVQEAFIQLAGQPQAPESPGAWLYQTVRRRALNKTRGAKRRTIHEREAGRHRAEEGRGHSGEPADIADLRVALNQLDPVDREIVVLRIWGRLSWQEIADTVSIRRTSAQRMYSSSLNQLRQTWEPEACPKNQDFPKI